jgi:cardiolipin synthase
VLLKQLDSSQWVVILRLIALDATVALTIASGLHYAWLIASHRSTSHGSSSPSSGSST